MWLPPENILRRHFEKYFYDMDLQHIRNTIFLLYMQKSGEIPIFETFLSEKKINFGRFAENRHFQVAMIYYVIVTSYVDRFS